MVYRINRNILSRSAYRPRFHEAKPFGAGKAHSSNARYFRGSAKLYLDQIESQQDALLRAKSLRLQGLVERDVLISGALSPGFSMALSVACLKHLGPSSSFTFLYRENGEEGQAYQRELLARFQGTGLRMQFIPWQNVGEIQERVLAALEPTSSRELLFFHSLPTDLKYLNVLKGTGFFWAQLPDALKGEGLKISMANFFGHRFARIFGGSPPGYYEGGLFGTIGTHLRQLNRPIHDLLLGEIFREGGRRDLMVHDLPTHAFRHYDAQTMVEVFRAMAEKSGRAIMPRAHIALRILEMIADVVQGRERWVPYPSWDSPENLFDLRFEPQRSPAPVYPLERPKNEET